MSLLTEAFNPKPRASWPVTDDHWYVRDISGYVMEAGGSGVALSADSILRCGTVLAAVRFRANSWAMCPPSTFRKTPNGREEMPQHYSQLVLRNPNPRDNGFRWRQANGCSMTLWGNAYNEIVSRGRSFADELWPRHPTCVRLVDQRADGSLVYLYSPPGERERRIGQESMLHFRDLSMDGIRGVEMYRLIRNAVGIALLAEQHATTFLRKGARISGLLIPSSPLEKEQRAELRESVNAGLGGPTNTGTLGVLPHGVDLKPLSISHREAQFLEISDQVVGMILRALGVPGVVVGWMGDKTATYASADAFFEKGGIKHCVLPILTNVEAEEELALLPPDSGLQIKHNLDALQRANWKDRIAGLVQACGGPIFSVNEGREIEDFNRIDDPRFDRPHVPSNMVGGDPQEPDEPRLPAPPPRRPPADEDEEAQAPRPAPQESRALGLASLYASDAAKRIVKRELAAIAAKAPKFARNKDGWRAFVLEMYGKHAAHVAAVLHIPEATSRAYCESQASALLAGGVSVTEVWEQQIPSRLVAMVLGGQHESPA